MRLNTVPSRGVFVVFLASSIYALTAGATPTSGTLFYTTFAGGPNVWKVDYNYDGLTTFTLSNNTNIASTRGADGLLFAPNGNLLVAGQGNNLTEITPSGAFVNAVAPGAPSFHLALTSNAPNALVYNMWNGGGNSPISAVTLSAGGLSGAGNPYTVSCSAATPNCSTDVRGVIFNPTNNTWFYGTAPDGASGEFGTVVFNDVAHTATLTTLKTGLFAHGLTFDPFTGNVIVSSANTIQQLDAAGNILGTATGTGNFDQSASDGKGHLFLASNSGFLEFIDYSATSNIGSASFLTEPFLANALDDIAPLSGTGSHQAPEPATLALLGLAVAGIRLAGRRKLK